MKVKHSQVLAIRRQNFTTGCCYSSGKGYPVSAVFNTFLVSKTNKNYPLGVVFKGGVVYLGRPVMTVLSRVSIATLPMSSGLERFAFFQ